ncbi:hypothetical protein D3D02_06615 [Halobellus sp. Atlit-38R]|jgi:hypothetical protein|uniref:hypothetical protein n=1 Tax=Halobellus sp. Atlit-38R TaxID=2282131 RepID=UPI000EF1D5CC|nr:hypothetical protein [Halobellus sp. Atlit-38R]RLM90426.1 hypothetical protein D3D02_06615 [Halobellus sp. Atlit-38R]
MQRRAAAIYVALFIVIGAASYSLIATAQAPHVEFENPEYELAQGDQFQVGEQTYTVSTITTTEQGGGHGGIATTVVEGELQYTNESARYTAAWENNSTQSFDGNEWRVLVGSGDDPTTFTLREDINETAILQEDPAASEEMVTQNGTQYVVIDGSELVPASEYFPEPETRTYAEGDTVQYEGNASTIDAVTTSEVTLAWTGPRTNTIGVSDNSNVTLGGETYLAHFADESTLQLTQDFESFQQQNAEIDQYTLHKNGLWGVSIASFLTVIFLVGFAYLPSRY